MKNLNVTQVFCLIYLKNNNIIYTTDTTYKTNITYITYITYLHNLQYHYLYCYNNSQYYLNLTFIIYRNNIEDASWMYK